MSLFDSVKTQTKILAAARGLSSANPAERETSLKVLEEIGEAALPILRLVSASPNPPRMQFAAMALRHRLGDAEGLRLLTDALRWRLTTQTPEVTAELQEAFVRVGLPDAVSAILNALPEPDPDSPVWKCACGVFARLKDPRGLDALITAATRLPPLFVETAPAFGELAVRPLARMTREDEPARRLLAVRVLTQIASERSYDTLVPLLRDPDIGVREQAANALENAVGAMAVEPLAEACRAGFATQRAVDALCRLALPAELPGLLTEVLDAYDPAHAGGLGEAAVIVALSELRWMPADHLTAPLSLNATFRLLGRRPSPRVLRAAVQGLDAAMGWAEREPVHQALKPLLSHADAGVRGDAGRVLKRFGDTLGVEMEALLEECRPQENIVGKLHGVLRGADSPEQAAEQALQSLGQWAARVGKAAAGRLAGGSARPLPDDPRLPGLMAELLANTLTDLGEARTSEQAAPLVAQGVAVCRALTRLPLEAARTARSPLLSALHTVRRFNSDSIPGGINAALRPMSRDAAGAVRAAAAQTLLDLYGADAFPLLLEALYGFDSEVRATAVLALRRLGDVRALPHLAPLLADPDTAQAARAQEATAAIRRARPEVMTLLRASSGGTRPDELLRPAAGNLPSVLPDLLLRPSESPPQKGT